MQEAKGGDKVGGQDRLDRRRAVSGVGLDLCQALEPLPVNRADDTVEHGAKENLLGAEVVMNRRKVDAGLTGDGSQRRAGEPVSDDSRSAASRMRSLVFFALGSINAISKRSIQSFV